MWAMLALGLIALLSFVPGSNGQAADAVKVSLLFLAAADAVRPFRTDRRAYVLAWIVGSQIALCFTGFYFSDDALRHLHDGFYLLRRVDVYVLPPGALPAVVPTPDYHRMIGSVYFPVVQMLAVAGSLFSVERGYILVYHVLLALVLSVLVLQIRGRYALRYASRFLFSPAFVFLASGRHEDLLALSIFFLAFYLKPAAGGFLTGLLPFLKPDAGFLVLFSSRRFLPGQRRPWMRFLLAATASGALLVWFSLAVLIQSDLTISSFLANLRFFADWYAGYNPFSAFGPEAFVRIRPWLVLISCAAVLAAVFARAIRKGANRWPRVFDSLAAGGVLTGFAARGVWHPWYFCSAIASLIFLKKRSWAARIPPLLVLFYLPIADLRAGRGFYLAEFYVAVLALVALQFGHIFLTGRNSARP